MSLYVVHYVKQGGSGFFIHLVCSYNRLSCFRWNKHRSCLAVNGLPARLETEEHFTALIKACFNSLCAVCVLYSRRNGFSLKLRKVQQIVTHHSALFGFCIERLGK